MIPKVFPKNKREDFSLNKKEDCMRQGLLFCIDHGKRIKFFIQLPVEIEKKRIEILAELPTRP